MMGGIFDDSDESSPNAQQICVHEQVFGGVGWGCRDCLSLHMCVIWCGACLLTLPSSPFLSVWPAAGGAAMSSVERGHDERLFRE